MGGFDNEYHEWLKHKKHCRITFPLSFNTRRQWKFIGNKFPLKKEVGVSVNKMVIRLMMCWSVDKLSICLVKWCIYIMQWTWYEVQMVYSTDMLMIGPTSYGDGPAFFYYQNQISYGTKSSLSSRLSVFQKLIDWVIHVDIVYQCWKQLW